MTSHRPAASLPFRPALVLACVLLTACGQGTGPETGDEPAVTILEPEDGAVVALGVNDPLVLRGRATDPQEGELSGEALRWRSDAGGRLGRGRRVELERLAVGPHRISLVATDSDGNSASVTQPLVVDRIVGPRVLLAPDTLVLTSLEDTAVFRATVLRSAGDTAETSEVAVRWTIGDPSVAVSRGDGVFGPRRNGTTAVTARALGAWGRAVLEVRDGWMHVTAGRRHTCGLTTDSLAYCWGSNDAGQLGDGTREERTAPVPVAGGRRFAAIDAGDDHTCAIAADGELLCWGANGRGQLGTGRTEESAEPTRVQTLEAFRVVSAGGDHTCGITADGEALCWGAGEFGRLGYGGESDRLQPTSVAGQGFEAVAAGTYHTCSVADNGVLACWGRNDDGQLGLGDTFDRLTPAAQEEIRAFRQVAAGRFHSCALSGGSAAFCWGENGNGQIGNGNRRRQLSRAGVEGGGRFDDISAGARHTCAVRGDGTLFCWGDNRHGQIGDGSDEDRLSPVPVPGPDAGFRSVAAGGRHTCALTGDWSAFCWGDNGRGQLGTGDRTASQRPVRIPDPGN